MMHELYTIRLPQHAYLRGAHYYLITPSHIDRLSSLQYHSLFNNSNEKHCQYNFENSGV